MTGSLVSSVDTDSVFKTVLASSYAAAPFSERGGIARRASMGVSTTTIGGPIVGLCRRRTVARDRAYLEFPRTAGAYASCEPARPDS